jgi:hypothetical protein
MSDMLQQSLGRSMPTVEEEGVQGTEWLISELVTAAIRIPDDPANVYFAVCVLSLDVIEDDETRLHRTAAAQVFAFILHAFHTRPPPESWYDKADRLDTRAIEYNDIVRSIPVTERKHREPRASPYKPQRWKCFQRSPIRTRSRCQQPDAHVGPREDDDNDEDPPSPTPRAGGKTASSTRISSRGGRRGEQRQGQHKELSPTEPSIQNRPSCTQQCLLGLAIQLTPRQELFRTRTITSSRSISTGSISFTASETSSPRIAVATRIVRHSIDLGHAVRSSRCDCRRTAIHLWPRASRLTIAPTYSTKT